MSTRRGTLIWLSDRRHWYAVLLLTLASMGVEDALTASGASRTEAFLVALPLIVVTVVWAVLQVAHATATMRVTVGLVLTTLLLWPSPTSIHHEMTDLATVIFLAPILLAVIVMLLVEGVESLRHPVTSGESVESGSSDRLT